MAALHSPHPMGLFQVLYKGLAVRGCIAAALLKAVEGQWLCCSCCCVALEVLLECLAEAEFLPAHRTDIGI
jgi:H2-forming N5,N10-methylenetetrahydromethanopterin dehydrogenase-like enzyme